MSRRILAVLAAINLGVSWIALIFHATLHGCPGAVSETGPAADNEPFSAVTGKARALFQSNLTDRQSMQICMSYYRNWSIRRGKPML